MICKQCGTYCEQNRSFCPVCRAPLPIQEYAEQEPSRPEQGDGAEATDKTWGFVPSPRWPSPKFDVNAVDDLPPVPDAYDASFADTYNEPAKPGKTGGQVAGAAAQRNFAPRAYSPNTGAPPPQSTGKPIASVGGYDDVSGYHSSFGRAPQRVNAAYQPPYGGGDEEEDDTMPNRRSAPIGMRRSRPGNASSRSRGSTYRRSGSKNMLFIGIAAVLVILLIVFGIILINKNYGSIGGFFSSVFGGSPILKEPMVAEGVNDQGTELWIITIYTQKDNKVTMRIGGLEESKTVGKTNQMDLQVPKFLFMPAEPVDGPTAQMIPDISITTKDGEVVPVDVPPITVQVPALNMQVTEPAGTTVEATKSKMAIAGKVDDGSVAVTVNGQALQVGADGAFAGEYEFTAEGANTVTIEARKNGFQIARQSIQVNYTQSEASIKVDRSSLRAPGNGDATVVKGEIDPGASMQVSAPSGVTISEQNVNDSTGIFSFKAQMSEIGAYALDVTVTKDGVSTNGNIYIERAPDYTEYTAKVYAMDYNRMTKEPQHTARYKCTGTVTEIIQTEPYIIAKLQTSAGDMLFEYRNTAATIEVGDGKTYNIFGDYKGVDEASSLPTVYAWFITKK